MKRNLKNKRSGEVEVSEKGESLKSLTKVKRRYKLRDVQLK